MTLLILMIGMSEMGGTHEVLPQVSSLNTETASALGLVLLIVWSGSAQRSTNQQLPRRQSSWLHPRTGMLLLLTLLIFPV